MNGVNILLTFYTGVLNQALAYLDARYAWLLTLHLWALNVADLARYITLYTKEPITRSHYDQELQAARERMVPASELAELLTEDHEGWTDSDLEPQEGEDEPLVTDAAWERVCREKERELARLVEQGVLVGGRKGRGLVVQAGSFYDWLGEPVPVLPDWGFRFEVLPDKEAAKVRRLRRAREAARESMQRAPLDVGLDLVRRKLGHPPKESSRADEIAEALATHLREGIVLRWRELLEVEQVLEEIPAEFDGEDPARPRERSAIVEGKNQLKDLHEQVQDYVGPFDLPGPDEDELGQMREAIRRAGER